MIRSWLSCFVLLIGLCCFPGCGGNDQAEFTPPEEGITEEEEQAAEEYEKQLEEYEQRQRQGG